MRPITILLLMMFFLLFPLSKGENITVELVPSSMGVKVGNTFNLDLVVKNVPENGKCGGFETKIYYDSNILNLSNIQLSNIGEGADLKNINPSSGSISLVWFSNTTYGNFTLATISFKGLNPGEINITLKNVAISTGDGTGTYKNISTYPATVTVKSLNDTVGNLTLKNYKINSSIEGTLSLIVAETPVKNISGSITLSNVSLVGIPVPPDVGIFKNYSYSIKNNTLSFFAVPSKEYENKTVFDDFLKIPLLINSSTYNITINLTVNRKLVKNISIKKEIKEKNITTEYSGLIFYVDGYSEETNISLGYSKEIKLKVYNLDKNLTNFSGYVFINNSLFNVLDYEVPKYSIINNRINYSNITYNNSYLYFNISLTNGTNGTYSILKFTLSPKTNENISSLIYLGNISIYENNTAVSLPYKNLTVHIIERKKNTPPRLKVFFSIEDNKKVYFRALGYDADNESLRYLWDFGDGKNSTLQDPIHIYSNYSVYLVSCTVWDNLNKSDKVEFILPIMDISPIESYSLSNRTIFLNNSKNHTVYINLSLKNPFEYEVIGYINFVDYYNNYHPSKVQYYVELKPNETKNLLIPINITKSCDIKWNIVYCPLYRDKLIKDVELKYYQWNFKEKIEVSKYREKSVNESIIYKEHINNYSKVLNVSNPDVLVKIRGYGGEYVVYRDVVVSTKSIYFYIFASLSGFIIGLVAILAIKK
ncbi:PKD domain-containing protein [Methanothermococcus sp. SCGC AD-155-M21]|nr:PKD domain-containing protein [Methanothermococcus sp. SCGC AD-155-M21]